MIINLKIIEFTSSIPLELIAIFIAAGLVAGFVAGLLGIGGGFVTVPVLLAVLPAAGIPDDQIAHFAIGTSLLCICITSLASSRAHHQRKSVIWPLFRLISPGLIVGALAGSALASLVKSQWLVLIFIAAALMMAGYLIIARPDEQIAEPSGAGKSSEHKSAFAWLVVGYGHFTGLISSLIGIGGGSILVPFLVYRGKSIQQAVGTAAACGFPIALFGALGYALNGVSESGQVTYSTGFLYWPAFLGIAIFSSFSAPFGAKLAHAISQHRLKQVFAAFLILTSVQILYSQVL